MNANDAWAITERMMQGDFNPYHDEGNGQFTFANAVGAVAPLHGKTENGERLLQGYKEKHGGKKAENATEGKQAEGGKKTSQKGEQAASKPKSVCKAIDHEEADELAIAMGQTKHDMGEEDYRTLCRGEHCYFGSANSFELNRTLRSSSKGYDALSDADKKTVKTMDAYMAPLPEGIKTIRAVSSPDFFRSLEEQGIPLDSRAAGCVFVDPGYSSSSFDISDNVFKHRDVHLKINAPEGSKVLFSPERGWQNRIDEAEVVFARGTAFEIKSLKKKKGEWGNDAYEIEVEVLVDGLF